MCIAYPPFPAHDDRDASVALDGDSLGSEIGTDTQQSPKSKTGRRITGVDRGGRDKDRRVRHESGELSWAEARRAFENHGLVGCDCKSPEMSNPTMRRAS